MTDDSPARVGEFTASALFLLALIESHGYIDHADSEALVSSLRSKDATATTMALIVAMTEHVKLAMLRYSLGVVHSDGGYLQ